MAGLLLPAPAVAQLFSADAFSLSGDVRLIAVDSEESWLGEGYGKLRSGGEAGGAVRAKPELGSIDLAWQPSAGFAWSATVVATVQGGERAEAGLSEAFVSYKPMRGERHRLALRAGLMWPPVSLEHGGTDWHVIDTVTPSAINSWIGEEVRPLALEGSVGSQFGDHQIDVTLGAMAANDTAGALLALRGWALHDRKTLAFHRHPLPPLTEKLRCCQPQVTTPLLDVERGFANRSGYYSKLAWRLPVPVRLELFHYDNRADPEAVNQDLEWGWRTRFDNVGLVAQVTPSLELKAQGMKGSTLMGYHEGGRIWVDAEFASAFVLAGYRSNDGHFSLRGERFKVENEGSFVGAESDERGWAATAAYARELSRSVTVFAEFLHVRSLRMHRAQSGLDARQNQTQLQFVARARW